MKKILILCTGNSARSQMAEALLKHIVKNEYEVASAGTKPSTVRPEAVRGLAEIGIDISHNRSKSIDEFKGDEIGYVLTACDQARENRPYFPARAKLIHHSFEDPAEAAGDEAGPRFFGGFAMESESISKTILSKFSKRHKITPDFTQNS